MSALSRREKSVVLAIAVLALALRVAFGLQLDVGEGGLRGYGMYPEMADRLLAGKGLAWQAETDGGWRYAHRTPLYPLFVAGVRWAFGTSRTPIVVAQALLAALSVVVLHRLARRLAGPPVAVVAAALFALYPYAVGNDTAYGEQPLLTFLTLALLLALDAAIRAPAARRFAFAGALAGLSILTRATHLVAVALAIAAAAWLADRRSRRRAALTVVACLAAFAVCVPWMARNSSAVRSFTLVTDGGRALWIGNNPHTFDVYPEGSIDGSERAAWAALHPEIRGDIVRAVDFGKSEIEVDSIYRDEALVYIDDHPAEFLGRGLRKALALVDVRLTPEPDRPWKSWVYSASYGLAVLLAIVGFATLGAGRRGFLPWLALVVGYLATSFVFWGQTRLRVSLDPPLLALAAAGLLVLPGGRALKAWLDRALPGSAPATDPTPP